MNAPRTPVLVLDLAGPGIPVGSTIPINMDTKPRRTPPKSLMPVSVVIREAV
jgi:hypothetical protein